MKAMKKMKENLSKPTHIEDIASESIMAPTCVISSIKYFLVFPNVLLNVSTIEAEK